MPEIVLAQRNGRSRVVRSHGPGQIGFRMRADPGDEQNAAQHHEGPDLALVFRRQFLDAAVTPDPGGQKPWNLGPMLEERDRRGTVIEVPGEAAIVEIDDLGLVTSPSIRRLASRMSQ